MSVSAEVYEALTKEIADLGAEVAKLKAEPFVSQSTHNEIVAQLEQERDELLSLLDTIKTLTDCEWTQEQILTFFAAQKRLEGE